ncbi:MAG: hypothetical protein GEV04_18705 [Actinophytocola sp.]|nr:hypothetical protein [Actinophytocola sp.]
MSLLSRTRIAAVSVAAGLLVTACAGATATTTNTTDAGGVTNVANAQQAEVTAEELRITLERQLGQHAMLAIEAMRAGVAGQDHFDAAAVTAPAVTISTRSKSMRIAIPLAAAAIALSACAMSDQDEDTSQAAPTTSAASSPEASAATTQETTTPRRTTETQESKPSAGTKKVQIVDFTFEPGDITVPVGTTVVWVQQDDSTHTVDFDDGTQSGDMAKGDTYKRTFDEPGKYPYVCFYHPRMTGTVTVNG